MRNASALRKGEIMNAGYDYMEQHDEVLDAVEQDIISVNLPTYDALQHARQQSAERDAAREMSLRA